MFIRTIAHSWCSDHSTSISTCGMWGGRTGIQVSKREFHTNTHLDLVIVEFLSCKKKKNVYKKMGELVIDYPKII